LNSERRDRLLSGTQAVVSSQQLMVPLQLGGSPPALQALEPRPSAARRKSMRGRQ
jgi:hypothetical protein